MTFYLLTKTGPPQELSLYFRVSVQSHEEADLSIDMWSKNKHLFATTMKSNTCSTTKISAKLSKKSSSNFRPSLVPFFCCISKHKYNCHYKQLMA